MKDLNLILKNIKNKELQPVYFFYGEEPYFIDVAVKAFENDYLPEDSKAFDQTVVYGKDTSYTEILQLTRQFPMLGDKQVVIVKEAQDMKMTEEEAEALKKYAENPVESTLLVVAHKGKLADARKAYAKTLTKNKMLIASDRIKDYLVPKWIEEELKKNGVRYKPSIPALLSDHLGSDLSRIANELEKLQLILKDGVLDEAAVEKHIGISKDFNVFELLNALQEKNAAKAFRVAHFLGKNPKENPFPRLMYNIYTFFSNLVIYQTLSDRSQGNVVAELKISPFAVKNYAVAARHFPLKSCTRIISVLREMDLKSKGLGAVNMTEAELLKEMVYKILNVENYKVKI